MWFDVGGAAGLGVGRFVEPGIASFVRAQMAPYSPMPGPEPGPARIDVVLAPRVLRTAGSAEQGLTGPAPEGDGHSDKPTFVDVENDAGDGLVTAWDGTRAFVLRLGRWCVVPDVLAGGQAVFEYQHGFPIWDIWGPIIMPALSLTAARHGAIVVHASAVEVNGRAVLVGGWSESGKTEVALALAERGAKFISDKWSVIRPDGTVAPFPASVGIRRWVVRYLPKLRAALPMAARAQLAGAAVAGSLTAPIRRRSNSGLLLRAAAGASDRATAVADRVSMSSVEVRRIYGGDAPDMCEPVPLSTIVLLTTVPDGRGQIDSIEPAVVSRRLARSAAFERRAYFSVGERVASAAGTAGMSGAVESAALEESLLGPIIAGVRLLEARTDFPADPRRVADAVLGACT